MQPVVRRVPVTCLALVGLLAFVAPAFSQTIFDVFPEWQSNYLPGTFVVLANPTTGGDYLATITDPIFGTTQTGYSYPAVLDTGSSGSVICATEAQGRNLPTTGDSYSDQGIGGTESFYVSSPTTVKLAAVDSGAVVISSDGSSVTEHLDMFNQVGVNKLQIRQFDPVLNLGFGITSTVMINTIGTPLLNQSVMHVRSGAQAFAWQMDTFGAAPVNYVPSELVAKSSLPSDLNLGSSELVLVPKVGGIASALHVPLVYENFITDPNPAPSVSTNPTIPGVVASLGGNSTTSNWLFDSGAAVTMMGRNLATSLGIDLNQPGITSTTVLGIGGTVSFQGYQISQLALDTADGGQIDFHDVVVFVPGEGDLPADLPGIFGMNLINNSFSGISSDLFGGIVEDNPVSSLFSDWYVVSGSQLPTCTWTGGDAAGPTRWGVVANWNPDSAAPNAPGITVTFGSQPAANSVVDMISSGKTVGNIVFLGMTNTTIQSSGGFALYTRQRRSTLYHRRDRQPYHCGPGGFEQRRLYLRQWNAHPVRGHQRGARFEHSGRGRRQQRPSFEHGGRQRRKIDDGCGHGQRLCRQYPRRGSLDQVGRRQVDAQWLEYLRRSNDRHRWNARADALCPIPRL